MNDSVGFPTWHRAFHFTLMESASGQQKHFIKHADSLTYQMFSD